MPLSFRIYAVAYVSVVGIATGTFRHGSTGRAIEKAAESTRHPAGTGATCRSKLGANKELARTQCVCRIV